MRQSVIYSSCANYWLRVYRRRSSIDHDGASNLMQVLCMIRPRQCKRLHVPKHVCGWVYADHPSQVIEFPFRLKIYPAEHVHQTVPHVVGCEPPASKVWCCCTQLYRNSGSSIACLELSSRLQFDFCGTVCVWARMKTSSLIIAPEMLPYYTSLHSPFPYRAPSKLQVRLQANTSAAIPNTTQKTSTANVAKWFPRPRAYGTAMLWRDQQSAPGATTETDPSKWKSATHQRYNDDVWSPSQKAKAK